MHDTDFKVMSFCVVLSPLLDTCAFKSSQMQATTDFLKIPKYLFLLTDTDTAHRHLRPCPHTLQAVMDVDVLCEQWSIHQSTHTLLRLHRPFSPDCWTSRIDVPQTPRLGPSIRLNADSWPLKQFVLSAVYTSGVVSTQEEHFLFKVSI